MIFRVIECRLFLFSCAAVISHDCELASLGFVTRPAIKIDLEIMSRFPIFLTINDQDYSLFLFDFP